MEIGELQYDNLVIGDDQPVTKEYTLIAGQNLVRGTLLGQISASKKLTQWDTGSADGSEDPHSILIDDTDAVADSRIGVYAKGVYNKAAIIIGTGEDIEDAVEPLRSLAIVLKNTQGVS
jgi:hypothetical protein